MAAEQDSMRALAAQRPGLSRPHLWSGTPGSPSSGRSCPSRSAGTCGCLWPGPARASCSHRSGPGQGPWRHARHTPPDGHRHTRAGTRCPSPRRSGGHEGGQQTQNVAGGGQAAGGPRSRPPDPSSWRPKEVVTAGGTAGSKEGGPGRGGNGRQGLCPNQMGGSLGSSEG